MRPLSLITVCAALFVSLAPAVAPAQTTPGVTGGAISLPEFDLTAAQAGLEAQLAEHRRQLTAIQQQPPDAGVPAAVLGDQLRLRIAVLEIFVAAVPAVEVGATVEMRRQQSAQAQAQVDVLQPIVDDGKDSGLGPAALTAIEMRLAQLRAAIEVLTATPVPGPVAGSNGAAPGQPAPAPPPPVAPTAPAPAPPVAPEPLPRLTVGNFISAINNTASRMEEIRRRDVIAPSDVYVIDVATVLGGGQPAITQAINRAFFAPLHSFIEAQAALSQALATAGVAIAGVVAIDTLPDGRVLIFHSGGEAGNR